MAGKCAATCPGTQVVCSGQCVDNQTDPRHCGACGMACAAGQACVTGMCQASCAAPNTVCSGACTNTQNDPANCGACGNACDAGVCANGSCRLTCLPPLTECAGGACADLRGDPNHCGACGNVCAPSNTTGPTCNAGTCAYTACLPGFSDCDDDTRNGCEVMGSCVRTVKITKALDGGAANGTSYLPRVSADGTRVVFGSTANNMTPDQFVNSQRVFLWDQKTGKVTLIDTMPDGGPGVVLNSHAHGISANGRFACMVHDIPLTNQVPAGQRHVYVRDLELGVTRLVSAYPDGGPLPGGDGNCPISNDGRFVAFSTRTSLVPQHNNGEVQIYVHDMQTGTNMLVSVDDDGNVGVPCCAPGPTYGANAFSSVFSGDFSKVAWTSAAGFPFDTAGNSCFDTWYRDLDAGVTTKVSVSGACSQAAARSAPLQIFGPRRTVLMNSTHADLPGDNNNVEDVYVRDMAPTIGAILLESDSQTYALPNQPVTGLNASEDGRWLLMSTRATNLCPVRGAGPWLMLKDLVTGSVEQVNLPEASTVGSAEAALSANGRFVVFRSGDTVMPGADGTAGIFWRQLR